MATFIERCIQVGDFYTDGGAIDLNHLYSALSLYDSGVENAALIKTLFNTTSGQSTELDEILATRPGIVLGILTQAQWVHKVTAVMFMGFRQVSGYTTDAACRTKLGI